MRGIPDRGPYHDVRGVAIKRFDRVCFCREEALVLAYVAQVSPYMILLEPDTGGTRRCLTAACWSWWARRRSRVKCGKRYGVNDLTKGDHDEHEQAET